MKTASMPKPAPAARASPDSLRRTLLYMSGLSIACGVEGWFGQPAQQQGKACLDSDRPSVSCGVSVLTARAYFLGITFPTITLSAPRILMSSLVALTSIRWYLPGAPGAVTVTTTSLCSTE